MTTHEELKKLANQVYKSTTKMRSWKHLKTNKNIWSGFKGSAYMQDNNIVITFSGTNKWQLQDWISNDMMSYNLQPWQLKDARKLYKDMKTQYPNVNITFTGHSLGGSLSQLMSAETGNKAVAFSPYGTNKILANQYNIFNTDDLNIINYGNKRDIVFTSNINYQPGKTFVTESPLYNPSSGIEEYTTYGGLTNKGDINTHFLDNLGDLKDAKPFNRMTAKELLQKNKPFVLKGHVSKNVEYKIADKKPTTPKEFKDIETKNSPMKYDALKQESVKGLPDPKLEALKNLPVPAITSTSTIITNLAINIGLTGAIAAVGKYFGDGAGGATGTNTGEGSGGSWWTEPLDPNWSPNYQDGGGYNYGGFGGGTSSSAQFQLHAEQNVYLSAPQHHTGGVIVPQRGGAGRGEVIALLQGGEKILTAAQSEEQTREDDKKLKHHLETFAPYISGGEQEQVNRENPQQSQKQQNSNQSISQQMTRQDENFILNLVADAIERNREGLRSVVRGA